MNSENIDVVACEMCGILRRWRYGLCIEGCSCIAVESEEELE